MTKPIRAEDIQAEEVDWLWPIPGHTPQTEGLEGRIPRSMLTVIAGKPDTGKGMVAVRIGTDLSRAGYNVLHSAIEDSPGLITKPRYMAAGADLSRIHLWRFRLPERFNELAEYVVEHSIDLIIIDPLASSLSHGITRHSDNIRRVTDPLTELIEQTGTAVIVIEHALKRIPANSDPLSAIGGSGSGLPAATRMGYIFGTDPEDEDRKILCHVKGNISEKRAAMAFEVGVVDVDVEIKGQGRTIQRPALLFEEECIFDAMRLLKVDRKTGAIGRPADKRAQAAEWLTTYLLERGGPVKSSVIIEDAKQVGMATKTLRRAKADMNIVVSPTGGGPNCTWWLPDDILDALKDGDDEAIEAKGAELAQELGPNDGDDITEAPHEAADGLTLTDDDLTALLNGTDGQSDDDEVEGAFGDE